MILKTWISIRNHKRGNTMGVKANKAVGKNGLFSKAMDAINPMSSMRRAKGDVATRLGNKVSTNKNAMEELGKQIGEVGDDLEKLASLGDKMESLEIKNKALADRIKTINEKGFKGSSVGDKAHMIGQGVLNYYNPAANPGISKGQMALRYGVTAGAVGAGAIGARYASGGDLTHNSKGKKDIAGIPFI